MITCGLSCDRVGFGHFEGGGVGWGGGGSDDTLTPPHPPATGLLYAIKMFFHPQGPQNLTTAKCATVLHQSGSSECKTKI